MLGRFDKEGKKKSKIHMYEDCMLEDFRGKRGKWTNAPGPTNLPQRRVEEGI